MRTRPYLIYLAGLLLAYLIVLFGFVTITDTGVIGHSLVRVVAPCVELGLAFSLICVIGRWERLPVKARQLFCLLIATIVGSVYMAQTCALYISNSFISALAIENEAESRLVASPSLYVGVVAFVVWWAILVIRVLMPFPKQRAQAPGRTRNRSLGRIWSSFVVLVLLELYVLALQGKDTKLEAGFRQVPVAKLAYTGLVMAIAGNRVAHSVKHDIFARQEPVPSFAFQKDWVYEKTVPFASMALDVKRKRPNVVIIFTEGMSARLIDAYGSARPGLTPYIDQFASNNLKVINYFNHTAATYRGLQGQMTSGYPLSGGSGSADSWETGDNSKQLARLAYASLPSILRSSGYRTYFISPHPDSVALNTMLRSLDFDEVYSAETAVSELKIDPGIRIAGGSIDDEKLFESLKQLLQTHESPGAAPIFAGVYNIGTHAFLDTRPGGLTYGDGQNQVLNRFHNYDRAVGQFLQWFSNSPFSKNTILIFTADHSTYPDKYYREAVGEQVKPYFVDQIPLIIHDPFLVLPRVFDANGANSLSLAPTVLQLLGIQHAENSFLGRSLFDGATEQGFALSAIGRSVYVTTPKGVLTKEQAPQADRHALHRLEHQLDIFYGEQGRNAVFSPSLPGQH